MGAEDPTVKVTLLTCKQAFIRLIYTCETFNQTAFNIKYLQPQISDAQMN